MHKAKLKAWLVSKCLTTVKFMPASTSLNGNPNIIQLEDILHSDPIAAFH